MGAPQEDREVLGPCAGLRHRVQVRAVGRAGHGLVHRQRLGIVPHHSSFDEWGCALHRGGNLSMHAVRGMVALRCFARSRGLRHCIGRPRRAHIEIRPDASAACRAIARKGTGAMKHVTTRCMWVRDSVAVGAFTLKNIIRQGNVADVLPHAVASSARARACARRGWRFELVVGPAS